MPLAIFFIIVISAEVARELCFKFGALRSAKVAKGQSNIIYMFKILCVPQIWAGFILWGVEIVTWIYILQHCPLTIALPILSLCYVFLPITSRIFFRETISGRKLVAIACITIGVGLIGLTGMGG